MRYSGCIDGGGVCLLGTHAPCMTRIISECVFFELHGSLWKYELKIPGSSLPWLIE